MPEDMIQWLYGLQHFGIKLGLDNIRALLDALEHPERRYRTAIIAGTNGKGSVASMVDAMLAGHGLRSGLFTSPHLVRPNERIRVLGDDITTPDLFDQLRAIRTRIDHALGAGRLAAHPSFFETITATALQTFANYKLDAAVLEVGLGGRLDATNAVESDVSTIVSVDLDHVKSLGPTLADIAGEKAGVIKPGRPLISGVVQQSALDVVRRVCDERGATFVDSRERVRLDKIESRDNGNAFRVTLRTPEATYPDLDINLSGAHQIDNARVALATFEVLAQAAGCTPTVDGVRDGLARVRWPGRLQWVDPRDGGVRILLDGAHNASAVETLVRYLDNLQAGRPVLVFGATKGKPLDQLLGRLARFARHVVITKPPVTKGIEPAEVAAVARPLYERVECIADPAEALQHARLLSRDAGNDSYVLVTGSLYLLGDILGSLEDEPAPGPVAM